MSLLIGTSGWSYNDWVGQFYEEKTGKFKQYSKVFNTAEINSTFYSYPSQGMIWGLQRNAPPGFVFSTKLPKLITHDKWLNLDKDVLNDTKRFLELVNPLAEKLGAILIQLRPKFNFEEHFETLEAYFDVLPKNYEWAVEFRHNSWLRDETYNLLKKNNVAFTIVDEPLLPPETHITADFAYIRWHGHGATLWYDYEYSEEQLDAWIPRINEVTQKVKRTYGFFNNHYRANAVKNAVEMLDRLGKATEKQKSTLKKINNFRESKDRHTKIQSLDSFSFDDDLSVADLLTKFTDINRLYRGEKIHNKLDITECSSNRVKAILGKYYIDIDIKRRVLKHNCDDWRKGMGRKRICKHVVKLFLTLPPNLARDVLTQMTVERALWIFEE